MNKPMIVSEESYKHFKFENTFIDTFNSMIKLYDKSVDELNGININDIKETYGVCNCCYKLRYITPENVSTYVSHLSKALNSNILATHNVNDVEMFTVECVKRFMNENGCIPFESCGGTNHVYINPKTQTLRDLVLLYENDICDVVIYSKYELEKRVKNIKSDFDKLKNLHFGATMKNIVNGLPTVIDKSSSNDRIMCSSIVRDVFRSAVETFILFACTINTIAVKSIMNYCTPATSYTYTKLDDVEEDSEPIESMVTECCLLKTNSLVIRNKIPFNCNMRDIVLQDVHPRFKDTLSALDFIMNDSRSPFSILISKYCDKEKYKDDNRDSVMITKMFINDVKPCNDNDSRFGEESYTRNGGFVGGNVLEINDFHTDVNWLDKIAYGNNYLDGNYRKDAVGNHNNHNILNTLDMIYRIYGGCNLKSNADLADNICKVSNIMTSIISMYRTNAIENWHLVKDILTVFGEIMTRDMLRLYYNNTRVITYGDVMEDTVVPGYLYSESFYMEAETDTNNKKPTVTNDTGNNTPQGKLGQIKKKASDIIRQFMNWVSKQLSSFFERFNKEHQRELDWITKNQKLIDEISGALGKTFNPTVSNFPAYNVPFNELKNIKVDEVVNKYLNSQDDINDVKIKEELYPGPEAKNIASMKTEAEEIAALTNYILYKNIRAVPGWNGRLDSQHWNDLVDNLKGSSRLIESTTKAISEDLKKACTMLQTKIREEEIKSNTQSSSDNNEQNQQKSDGRATQLLEIVRTVSQRYYTTMLNVLRSKFYKTSYDLFRDIIKAYQQQNASANTSNGQNTTNPQGNEQTSNPNGQNDQTN